MTSSALASSVSEVDGADAEVFWRMAQPAEDDEWTVCATVGRAFVADWELVAAGYQRAEHGRSDAMAAAAFVLDWYGSLPGTVGGRLFTRARRVPRLGPQALAFRRHPAEGRPDGVALLDERFWCLPDDPAAGDGATTVVDDEQALAQVLRAEVRAHADWFLSWYRPGVKLARRNLLGAFFDGLDVGVWSGGEPGPASRAAVLTDAALVLPGGTPEFPSRSTLYVLTDTRGRTHLTRCRISCCHDYRLDDAEQGCFTCPRTAPTARPHRAARWEEAE